MIQNPCQDRDLTSSYVLSDFLEFFKSLLGFLLKGGVLSVVEVIHK